MEPIRIRFLGGFLLEKNGRALPPIPSVVGRSLFAYLVTNRDRRQTRHLLAGMFWPDLPEQSARRRLSQALWQIQTAVQDQDDPNRLIQSSAHTIAFSADPARYWHDVAAFGEHLEQSRAGSGISELGQTSALEAAVALYHGEFLAGFYDDWTNVERERLRGDYLGSLGRLIRLHKGRADYERALSFGRQLTLHDPLRESAHREVMRLCYLLGRSNEALQQYERCAAILSEQLSAAPTNETNDLRHQIAQLRDKGHRPFAPTVLAPLLHRDRPLTLVGRDEERTRVLRCFEETLLDRGGFVIVEGESGIGKSRFLEELVKDATWRGLTAVHVQCAENETLKPFSGLSRALEIALTRLRVDQLVELLPWRVLYDLLPLVPHMAGWLPPSTSETRDPRAIDGMVQYAAKQVLAALAELNPTALFIDDAQWADEESIRLITDLAPELATFGHCVIMAYRGSEMRRRQGAWKNLVDADANARTERVELRTLSLDQSRRLIEESLGGGSVDPDLSERVHFETGGNPLFLLETLRALHEESGSTLGFQGESRPDLSAIPIAGGVARVIARRLQSLDSMEDQVLGAAAVSGRFSSGTDLAAIADIATADALNALDGLISRGVLVETDGTFSFSHDQVRRVALDAIGEGRRQRLHFRAGTLLEENNSDRLEHLAYHFENARCVDKASFYGRAAGNHSARLGAYETAARHFEMAASSEVATDRFALLCEWENVLDILGRRQQQRKLLDQLAIVAKDNTELAELARRRSRLLSHLGEHRLAVAAAQQALDELGPGSPRHRLISNLGMVLASAGRPAEAVPHLEAALGGPEDDTAEQAGAMRDLGKVLCEVQRYEDSARLLNDAARIYQLLGDAFGTAEALSQMAIVNMERGDTDTAARLYEEALEKSRAAGYARGEAINQANLGNLHYHRGEAHQAIVCYKDAAAIFRSLGDHTGAALLTANAASVRHGVLGENVSADVLGSLEFFRREGHGWGEAFCHEHLAAVEFRAGNQSQAADHVRVGLRLLERDPHKWVEVHLLRIGGEIALDAGDIELAHRYATLGEEICSDVGLKDVRSTLLSLLGAIEMARGNDEFGQQLCREAVACLEPSSELPYVTWFRLHAAAERAGEVGEAIEALSQAVALVDQLLEGLPASAAQKARESVPQFRLIANAAAGYFPIVERVRIPRTDAPLGRPLASSEWVQVDWTVSDPSDIDVASSVDRRRRRLQRLVAESELHGASPRITDLADALDSSVATVRRDLASLRSSGIPISTRGNR